MNFKPLALGLKTGSLLKWSYTKKVCKHNKYWPAFGIMVDTGMQNDQIVCLHFNLKEWTVYRDVQNLGPTTVSTQTI